MVFRHVYDEEKCYIPPCLWWGEWYELIWNLPCLWQEQSMLMPCLWQEKMPCLWLMNVYVLNKELNPYSPVFLSPTCMRLRSPWSGWAVGFCWAERPMVQRVPPRDDHHFGGAEKLRRAMSVKFSGTLRRRFGRSLGILSLLWGSFRREVGF